MGQQAIYGNLRRTWTYNNEELHCPAAANAESHAHGLTVAYRSAPMVHGGIFRDNPWVWRFGRVGEGCREQGLGRYCL